MWSRPVMVGSECERTTASDLNTVVFFKGKCRMKASYLSVFSYPDQPLVNLQFAGIQEGEDLLNGKILADKDVVGEVKNGILILVNPDQEWETKRLGELREGGYIPRNWDNEISGSKRNSRRRGFCDELATIDGFILEVGTGPGGGNMCPVLERNPEALIIANDITLAPLRLWEEFFKTEGLGTHVCFAAFDAREKVLRDGSIAAVSSSGGFSNITQSAKAIQAANKALRPDGMCFMMESRVHSDDWAQMPEDRRRFWEERLFGLVEGYEDLVHQAGFLIESKEIIPVGVYDPEGSGLARDAAKHGVKLRRSIEYLKARKPERKKT